MSCMRMGLISIFQLCSVVAIGVDIDLSVDKSGWIDPNDPFSHSHHKYSDTYAYKHCDCENIERSLIQENSELRAKLLEMQLARENSVDVLMKHVLRQFMTKLNIDLDKTKKGESIYKKAQISLSNHEISVIRRYLASEKSTEEFSLREDLRAALDNFLIETDIRSSSSLFSLLHMLLPYILLLNVIILLPAAFILLRSALSLPRLFMILVISAFGLSCYFTYIRKYQEVLAQRFERSENFGRNGKHPCSPQGLVSEAFDLMLSYVTIKDKSECLKSYEDILIEPFLLVDPLQVLAEVLSNFFLAPLSVAGLHMNRFFKHFFANIPLPLALLMTIFIFLMPILMLWTILRIREHFARERRQEEQHFLLNTLSRKGIKERKGHAISQGQNEPEDSKNNCSEEERHSRRRPLNGKCNVKETTSPTEEGTSTRQSDHDSSADESLPGASTSTIHAIRQRMEERKKWTH